MPVIVNWYCQEGVSLGRYGLFPLNWQSHLKRKEQADFGPFYNVWNPTWEMVRQGRETVSCLEWQ